MKRILLYVAIGTLTLAAGVFLAKMRAQQTQLTSLPSSSCGEMPATLPTEFAPFRPDMVASDSRVAPGLIVSDELRVVFKPGVAGDKAHRIICENGGLVVGRLVEFGVWQVRLRGNPGPDDLLLMMRALRLHDEVKSVGPAPVFLPTF
jgi:hypothetical protein